LKAFHLMTSFTLKAAFPDKDPVCYRLTNRDGDPEIEQSSEDLHEQIIRRHISHQTMNHLLAIANTIAGIKAPARELDLHGSNYLLVIETHRGTKEVECFAGSDRAKYCGELEGLLGRMVAAPEMEPA
jgi:hypothetical protein